MRFVLEVFPKSFPFCSELYTLPPPYLLMSPSLDSLKSLVPSGFRSSVQDDQKTVDRFSRLQRRSDSLDPYKRQKRLAWTVRSSAKSSGEAREFNRSQEDRSVPQVCDVRPLLREDLVSHGRSAPDDVRNQSANLPTSRSAVNHPHRLVVCSYKGGYTEDPSLQSHRT